MYGMCNAGAMRKGGQGLWSRPSSCFLKQKNNSNAVDKVQSIHSDYITHSFRNPSLEMNVNIHEFTRIFSCLL